MEKDKSPEPKFTRRATRLSTCSSIQPEETSVEIPDLTLNDLVFGGELFCLDELIASFPGRRKQIVDLLRHIGPLDSPMLPLFVYGGGSTGKTSTILQVFKHLKRPFVYSSCRTCFGPRILFESVLNQLMLHRRSLSNGYSSVKRCEKASDFVNFFKEALGTVVKGLREEVVKKGGKKLGENAKGSMIYLIFDHLELVREWDKSWEVLPLLFKLYDMLNMHDVGIIFVSNAPPDCYYSNAGSMDLLPLYFPDYTEEDLRKIFMRNQENKKLYSSFLDIVLKPFIRVTRRVDELANAFSPLFEKFCEPLKESATAPELKNKLYLHVQPHIRDALNEVYQVPTQMIKKRKIRASEAFDDLDFHMSTSAKYLLMSAFLASKNPATLDASLFDSTGGGNSRKKNRKSSEKVKEMKEKAEQEQLLKGPGTFPLERLLAIFQCITSVSDVSLDDKQDEGLEAADGENRLMSDVLLQLSSLCNANFVTKGGSCPLEGSTRYRSLVSEDIAKKVAKSVNFNLLNYLYRG